MSGPAGGGSKSPSSMPLRGGVRHGATTLDPEVARLLRFLDFAESFALALVQYNVSAVGTWLIEQLMGRLPGRRGRVLDLKEPIVDLWGEIVARLSPLYPGDVVFVLGLEHSIPPEVAFPPVVRRLNLSRERFQELPGPMVLLLPEYALTKVAREAPDFWSWASVFELQAQDEIAVEETVDPVGSRRDMPEPLVRSHLRVLQEVRDQMAARGDRVGEADLSLQIARAHLGLSEFEAAREAAERALNLARNVEDRSKTIDSIVALGSALAGLGRQQEAWAASKEGVDEARRWAARQPDLLARLGAALREHARHLAALNRSREAAEASEEAVGIFRSLAAGREDEILIDLAVSLERYGLDLDAIGRHEEALAVLREAVGLYRRFWGRGVDLAGSLSNLALVASHLGRREKALAASREAVEILRPLAARDSVAPAVVALNLTVFAEHLRASGRHAEALAAVREATAVFRRLAAERPDIYGLHLAQSLANLGEALAESGRLHEALDVLQEATRSYRQIRWRRPELGLTLALALRRVAYELSATGASEEKVQAARAAVEEIRGLAADQPETLPELASSLGTLGTRLHDLKRHEEALRATGEAVEIFRRLAASDPEAHLPGLAQSLNDLSVDLAANQQGEAAAAAALEAVDLYRRLAAARSEAFLPELARSLDNLSGYLRAARGLAEARQAAEEAARIREILHVDAPYPLEPEILEVREEPAPYDHNEEPD